MKNLKYMILGFVLSVTFGIALGAKIEDDFIKFCVPGTADSCVVVFDTNDGAANMEIEANSGTIQINNGPLTSSQITASDIDLGTASNTSRLTLPKATSATISGLARKEATIIYDTDLGGPVIDNGVDLIPVGSGAGGAGAGVQVVENPDFEINANSWSATGGTVTQETGSPVANGKGSLRWTASGTGQILLPDAVVVPDRLNNASCLTSFWYRYTGGADGDVKVKIVDDATDLTDFVDLVLTPGTSEWRPVQLAYICPTGSEPRPHFETTVVSPQPFFLDDVWTGSDYRVGETAPKITGLYEKDILISDFISGQTGLSVSFGYLKYKRIGSDLHVTFSLRFGSDGSDASALTFQFPTDVFPNITFPLGIYGAGNTRIENGSPTLQYPDISVFRAPGGTNTLQFSRNLSSFINGNEFGTSDGRKEGIVISAIIPVNEWQNQGTTETVTLETQGWHIAASITGADISEPSADTTSFTELTNANLVLENLGSSTANIACANGIAPSGSTCSGGDEAVGINFKVPYSGYYEICTYVSIAHTADGANEFFEGVFQIAKATSTTDTTSSVSGKNRQVVGDTDNISSTNDNHAQSITLCEFFNLTGGDDAVFLFKRIMDKVTFTGVAYQMNGLSSGFNGARSNYWTVKPITQNFPQAVAIANVETGATADCTTGNICSGSYTPNIDIIANVNTVTPQEAFYTIVGDVVTVYGRFVMNTPASVLTQVDVHLPVPITISLNQDLAGVASTVRTASNMSYGGYIEGDTITNYARIYMQIVTGVVSNHNVTYTFSYRLP